MSDETETTTADTEEQESTSTETTDEQVTLSRSEVDALRKQAAEASKSARKAQQTVEAAQRKKAEDEGRWEQIAKDAEAKAQAAEDKLADAGRSSTIKAKADLLKFRDTETAELHLRSRLSGDQLDDDNLVERTLKAIAKEKDWLLRPEQRRSGTSIRTDSDLSSTDNKDDPRLAQGQRLLDAFTRGQ